jgi:hypothetical protein
MLVNNRSLAIPVEHFAFYDIPHMGRAFDNALAIHFRQWLAHRQGWSLSAGLSNWAGTLKL